MKATSSVTKPATSPAKTSYHSYVIRRFYVHNFRCLENFELPIAGLSSVLLIGDNGSGKSTIRQAISILQGIARGENRVDTHVKAKDFTGGRKDVPIRFEIEVEIHNRVYEYVVAFELHPEHTELRVLQERLTYDGRPIYSREHAQVTLAKDDLGQKAEAKFLIDWHVVALPLVQEKSKTDPLFIFRQWLSRVLILSPIPRIMLGEADKETLQPDDALLDFGDWFSGILSLAPAAYSSIDKYLKQVMPDFQDIRKTVNDRGLRELDVRFSDGKAAVSIPFRDLSDGEKSFMICALVLAANEAYGPLLCFWDEPDNHLALKDVGHFTMALRKAFKKGGQFLATSHNSEAIRSFSAENTLFLYRNSHLEPTVVRRLEEMQIDGNLVDALIRGDVEP